MPHASTLVPLPRLRSAIHHSGGQQVAFHTHDAHELVFVAAGDIRIDVKTPTHEEHLDGRAGILCVLPGNVPHNQCCGTPWKTLCVLFYSHPQVIDVTPRRIDIAKDELLQRWLHDLYALNEGKSESVCDSLLLALLNRINSLENQRRATEALHPRVADAVEFLRENLTQEVDAESLASAACTSYSHLSALFREKFGVAPLKYHQTLRMELARKLLLNPYLRMDEVAQQVGYEDTNYFVRLFRKAHKMPPGKWRKNFQLAK
jgi:AraC-like DNA-binding protein